MRKFTMMRSTDATEDGHIRTTVVELSVWDMFRLLLGREIAFPAYTEVAVIRLSPNYEAFNMDAGVMVAPELPKMAP